MSRCFSLCAVVICLLAGCGGENKGPLEAGDGGDTPSRQDTVAFVDAGLEAAVRAALEKPEGTLTQEEVSSLTQLDAGEKEIEDLAGIEQLKSLTFLGLGFNRIEDISSLGSLEQLRFLNLEGNHVVDLSVLTELTQLQVVILNFNQVEDISPLLVLEHLQTVELSGNPLGESVRERDFSSLLENDVQVIFEDPDSEPPPDPGSGPVVFADARLDSAVRTAVGKPDGELTADDVLLVTRLELQEIGDLQGIEYLEELRYLEIQNDEELSLQNVGSLASLDSLRMLRLILPFNEERPLPSLDSTLAEFAALEELWLGEVSLLGDWEVMRSLTRLAKLWLFGPGVDLGVVGALGQLEELWLFRIGDVGDISSLAALTNLKNLAVGGGCVADISPLTNLLELRFLNLQDNQVADLSPLVGLSELKQLILLGNQIVDIFPLLEMNSLHYVNVEGNPLGEKARSTDIPVLRDRGVDVIWQ